MDLGGEAGPAAVAGPAWAGGPVLLYDGTCGLCDASVQWILRRDRRGVLRFAPLQGETAGAVRRAYPEIDRVDSMVWIETSHEPGAARVLLQSDAALRVASYVGGIWSIAGIARLVPRRWRDAAYATIARHRHHLIRRETCVVHEPHVRSRFLP